MEISTYCVFYSNLNRYNTANIALHKKIMFSDISVLLIFAGLYRLMLLAFFSKNTLPELKPSLSCYLVQSDSQNFGLPGQSY